ncbi:hypothetical protein ACLOJK_005424 [Asimina triloba]
MDRSSFFRFACLAASGFLFLLIARTWLHLPQDSLDALDCTTFSGWCTSKNRIHATSSNPLPKPRRRPPKLQSQTPRHPLDPLTIHEIDAARSILSSHAPFSSINSLVLLEPDKPVVLRWKKGDPLPPRKAFAIALLDGRSHVLTLDLELGVVARDEISTASGYPAMTIEDMTTATVAPLADAGFNQTVRSRGVRLSDVACLPISLGWFGEKEEGRRLIKVQCYSMEGTANFYMRPIEGLTVVVDMDTKEVVEISDRGREIPIPKAENTDYRFEAIVNDGIGTIRLNPISIEQPKGPTFVVEDGHSVKWANWEFHLKPDPRAGIVISQARVRDSETGELRNVMYKGFSSELFVPYMDPTDAWYFKTYMDAGEYGFGLQAMPLDPLNDCPRNAYYMDAVFAAADGKPYVRSDMICVFERYAGEIGWRHSESPITGMGVPIRNLFFRWIFI